MDTIDLKDAMERVQDDKELLLELFDIFTEDFVGKYAQIKAAYAKGDCAEFQMLSHGFKGATGNISAKKMHAISIELDHAGKSCDISGMGPQVEALGQEFEAFKVEAAKIKKEFGK